MIPRILKLKNFLSYSGVIQTIDFIPYSLICLSGKNGHGKSALLDAITWAIWGQARKTQGTSKPDEGLLRTGQSRLFVSLEFDLNENTYRVSREFFKGHGRAVSSLEFQILDTHTKQFNSLTDKTIRATQEKIESTIRLDFDTFLNTSFFKQGSSNEFSKKTPRERKQILSRIMGLDRYDIISSRAQQKARSENEKLSTLIAVKERIKNELEASMNIAEQLPKKKDLFEQLKKQESDHSKALKTIEQKSIDLEKKLEALKSFEAEIDNFIKMCKKLRSYDKHKISPQSIEKLKSEKNTLIKEENKLFEQEKIFIKKSEEALSINKLISERKEALIKVFNLQKDEFREKIEHIKMEAYSKDSEKNVLIKKASEVKQNLENTNKLIKAYNETFKQPDYLEQQIGSTKKRLEKIDSYKNIFTDQQKTKSDQFEKLSSQVKLILCPKTKTCPTCLQNLDSKAQHNALRKISLKLEKLNLQIQRFKKVIPALEFNASSESKKIIFLQKTLIEQEKNKHIKSELEKTQLSAINEIKSIEELVLEKNIKLEKTKAEYSKLVSTYKKDFNCQNSLDNKISKDLELTTYRHKLEQLNLNQDYLPKLKVQQAIIRDKRNAIDQLIDHENINQTLKAEQKHLKLLIDERYLVLKKLKPANTLTKDEIIAKTESYLAEISKISSQKTSLDSEIQKILQEIGQLENELARQKKLNAECQKTDKLIASLKNEIDEYQVLVNAFGKNGIQALMIESVIPEIEQEANQILSQLSGGQAKIFIEPLKDLKKGGFRESLDIKICDNYGVRPYEMFSGGEAFRIDFALRIGISKLLARKAGACLQTLIIDEGFGSQDQDNLSKVMEAIHFIRKDFAKIIVVSHLQELKNDFPVHFLVEKKPTGSTVNIEFKG